jgi:hypothetical protein
MKVRFAAYIEAVRAAVATFGAARVVNMDETSWRDVRGNLVRAVAVLANVECRARARATRRSHPRIMPSDGRAPYLPLGPRSNIGSPTPDGREGEVGDKGLPEEAQRREGGERERWLARAVVKVFESWIKQLLQNFSLPFNREMIVKR